MEEKNKPMKLDFRTKFQGLCLDLSLDETSRVLDLKLLIQSETSVPAARQKLIGLAKGALPPDETLLVSLVNGLSKGPPYQFTLMGTPDDKLFIDPSDRDDLPEVRVVINAIHFKNKGEPNSRKLI